MSDTPLYQNEDLVYVDPDARVVIGRVEFTDKGLPKPLPMPSASAETDDEPDASDAASAPANGKEKPAAKGRRPSRRPRQRYYPWGTYRTMKKLFKIEGKIPEPERTSTLDDIMEKALQEPYWD